LDSFFAFLCFSSSIDIFIANFIQKIFKNICSADFVEKNSTSDFIEKNFQIFFSAVFIVKNLKNSTADFIENNLEKFQG
jgi:hypothetical protein